MVISIQNELSINSDITLIIQQSGIPHSGWYVGITSDIDERLYGFHKVPRQSRWHTCHRAITDAVARNVETGFHNLGCKGAGGGGDHTAVFVYAYVITDSTVQ